MWSLHRLRGPCLNNIVSAWIMWLLLNHVDPVYIYFFFIELVYLSPTLALHAAFVSIYRSILCCLQWYRWKTWWTLYVLYMFWYVPCLLVPCLDHVVSACIMCTAWIILSLFGSYGSCLDHVIPTWIIQLLSGSCGPCLNHVVPSSLPRPPLPTRPAHNFGTNFPPVDLPTTFRTTQNWSTQTQNNPIKEI